MSNDVVSEEPPAGVGAAAVADVLATGLCCRRQAWIEEEPAAPLQQGLNQ